MILTVFCGTQIERQDKKPRFNPKFFPEHEFPISQNVHKQQVFSGVFNQSWL